jgi:imidazolonepropionase-like amidohydrolase
MRSAGVLALKNCLVFDGKSERLNDGAHIVIENGRIKDLLPTSAVISGDFIDCAGRFVMPGLIDAHIHAYASAYSFQALDNRPESYRALCAGESLRAMLHRGFTSVRDAGGGDIGLAEALAERRIEGPRFFYAGKAISQTGGHGDMRHLRTHLGCECGSYSGVISRVADGEDQVRIAAREELRLGASQIKLFVSGGVSSPSDPIWMPQFTDREVRAAVEEAQTRRAYVMAHCHTQDAARRCVELGVRSIEHGSELDEATADLIAKHDVFVTPTLSVVDILLRHASELNVPTNDRRKLEGLYDKMCASIANCAKAGVKLGLGSDILGDRYQHLQAGELALRGRLQPALEVLRSATSVNASMMQQAGQIGVITPGAHADLLVLNFNPLNDLAAFQNTENMAAIIKGGQLIRLALEGAP